MALRHLLFVYIWSIFTSEITDDDLMQVYVYAYVTRIYYTFDVYAKSAHEAGKNV